MKFELEDYHRGITDEELIADLKRVANELNKLNTQRIDKEIIGRKISDKVPVLIPCDTLENEYIGITNIIKEKIAEGISKYEICVIARTKKELLEIKD